MIACAQYLIEEMPSGSYSATTVINRMVVRLGTVAVNSQPYLVDDPGLVTTHYSGMPIAWSMSAGWITDFETPTNLTIVPGSGEHQHFRG